MSYRISHIPIGATRHATDAHVRIARGALSVGVRACDISDLRPFPALMLLLVTRLAHSDKPLDWLSADVLASILFVVHLCNTSSAIDATVAIALQNQLPLALPII